MICKDIKLLTRKSEEVSIIDLDKWSKVLHKYIDKQTKPLFCVCLPELGYNKNGLLVKDGEEYIVMFNVKLLKMWIPRIIFENCISLGRKNIKLSKRWTFITVQYTDSSGEVKQRKLKGNMSYCVQHALDHFDGKLLNI